MKIYKICTKKDRGEDKKPLWPEIGTVFEGDKGLSGYLNSNPNVQIYLFEQKPRENGQNKDADVPF